MRYEDDSVDDTAFLVAEMLDRNRKNKAYIRKATIRILSRINPDEAYIEELRRVLAIRYDWILIELEDDSFGAIHLSVLNSARFVSTKMVFDRSEMHNIKMNNIDKIKEDSDLL